MLNAQEIDDYIQKKFIAQYIWTDSFRVCVMKGIAEEIRDKVGDPETAEAYLSLIDTAVGHLADLWAEPSLEFFWEEIFS